MKLYTNIVARHVGAEAVRKLLFWWDEPVQLTDEEFRRRVAQRYWFEIARRALQQDPNFP